MSFPAIKVTALSGKPLYVTADKIAGVTEHKRSTDEDPRSIIIMCVGTESEEWIVNESVDSIRLKLDNVT